MDFNVLNKVGTFLVQDGKVLVAQRKDNGKWEFPKGTINEDEKVETAVSRTMQTCLGIDGKPMQEIGSVESQTDNTIEIIMYIVVESANTLDIKLTEHSDYLFCKVTQLNAMDLADTDKKLIADYEEEIKRIIQ